MAQALVNELFRSVQGRIIRRAEPATVAQQDDFMKRARADGGAREKLQPEGILVLGHQDSDRLVARALGLPVPRKGEFLSVRVVVDPSEIRRPGFVVDLQWWVLTGPKDLPVEATVIPKRFHGFPEGLRAGIGQEQGSEQVKARID